MRYVPSSTVASEYAWIIYGPSTLKRYTRDVTVAESAKAAGHEVRYCRVETTILLAHGA